MFVSKHVDTNTFAKIRVKRKFLNDLIDFVINIVNNAINVDSLFTFRKINKKTYVKKFKTNQFQKKLNHFRNKAKSIESINKIFRNQEIFRKKIIRCRQKQITRHERQTQRRIQINNSSFIFFFRFFSNCVVFLHLFF